MKDFIKVSFVNGKPTEVPLTEKEIDALDDKYEDFEEDLAFIMDTYEEGTIIEVSPHGDDVNSTVKLNQKEVE